MARDNVDSLITDLSDYALDAIDLTNDSDLTDLIDNLEVLANDTAGFGGKIAQICPSKIRAQKDALSQVLNQLKTVSTNVAKELDDLADMLDNMPLKDLRGISGNISKTRARINNQLNTLKDTNNVDVQTPVMSNSQTTLTGPQSAILQNESVLWRGLKNQFKLNEAKRNGFSWDSISNNVNDLNIDVSDLTPTRRPVNFLESIMANGNIPKEAGDLNSSPNSNDDYDIIANDLMSDRLTEQYSNEDNENLETKAFKTLKENQIVDESKRKLNMENISDASHDLFKKDVNINMDMMKSLKETLASFKNSSDFDLDNVNMTEEETNDNLSLEGHIIDD